MFTGELSLKYVVSVPAWVYNLPACSSDFGLARPNNRVCRFLVHTHTCSMYVYMTIFATSSVFLQNLNWYKNLFLFIYYLFHLLKNINSTGLFFYFLFICRRAKNQQKHPKYLSILTAWIINVFQICALLFYHF